MLVAMIIVGILFISAFMAYACCVVAGMCDEEERKRGE